MTSVLKSRREESTFAPGSRESMPSQIRVHGFRDVREIPCREICRRRIDTFLRFGLSLAHLLGRTPNKHSPLVPPLRPFRATPLRSAVNFTVASLLS